MIDKKAKKILLQLYWKNGWTEAEDRNVSPDDFAYAKSKGVMFDPFSAHHDACMAELVKLRNQIQIADITRAFLSSLSTRRLDLRSSLSSYFLAKNMDTHKYKPAISGTFYENGEVSHHRYTCEICRDYQYGIIGDEDYENADLNVFNFERIKWGGVRHGEILYTLFDLRQFTQENITEPTQEDVDIFKNILKTIETSQKEDYPSALEKRLRGVLKSSKAEREVLMEVLGAIGVLKPQSYDRPIRGRNDWIFVEYWRGEDGYDADKVAELFGAYL